MLIPVLGPFSLAGGTALALRYGHRRSIDLDLFYHREFDQIRIISELERTFGDAFVFQKKPSQVGIFCFINEVKVDLVHYPHLPIESIKTTHAIRMYADADIAAMKIQAILGRAQKKDFWDLYELFQHYSLHQMMDWHKNKYPNQMLAISIPYALTYFDEAEKGADPLSFKGQSWEKIKQGISKTVREYLS